MRTSLSIAFFCLVVNCCFADGTTLRRSDSVRIPAKQIAIIQTDTAVVKLLKKIDNNTKQPKLFGKNLLEVSIYLSILTPIVLILWFRFNRKQILSANYYQEIAGKYAGFTDTLYPQIEKDRNGSIHSGIIMDILDVDSNGFFRGEFKYGENLTTSQPNSLQFEQLIDGVYTFLGKLNHEFSFPIRRHPYKPSANRIYLGKLYIVHRLDFLYEQYKFEDYVKYEFDIIHYRDMKTLKFTISTKYDNAELNLPRVFSLDKHFGLTFEPSGNVENSVFKGDERLFY